MYIHMYINKHIKYTFIYLLVN